MPEYSDAHYASLENALKTVEGFESISNAPGISQLTTAFMGGNAVSVFLDKLAECNWTTKDVKKGAETSKAIVGFNYKDLIRSLITAWIAVTAFLCASINVHVVRNMLKAEETSVKVKKDDEETAF